MAGLFLAIDGLDGVGKTTQVRLLSEHLVEEGFGPVFLAGVQQQVCIVYKRQITEVVRLRSMLSPRKL